MISESDIEIVRQLPENVHIKHAVFDHDGTLSTLREGWEGVMEPMMVSAILGSIFDISIKDIKIVEDTVRDFIDDTTGIQTLVQMSGLVDLVKKFGYVPESEVLDMYGYKDRYNNALIQEVRERVNDLKCGRFTSEDFQIRNAGKILRRLYDAGVKLYLASGTDHEDLVEEATVMGYADLFEGRIYGATSDIKIEAKREILMKIFRDNGIHGSELVVFGDGPVEIREARKCGGIAVGVASDEVARYGINQRKRTRLINAGADLIVPDFTDTEELMQLLGV